jgi:hypothetical protein
MKAYWHILTDNIMEQYEFTNFFHDQEFGFSLTPPDIDFFLQKEFPVFVIVNMHAESFDAFSFFALSIAAFESSVYVFGVSLLILFVGR